MSLNQGTLHCGHFAILFLLLDFSVILIATRSLFLHPAMLTTPLQEGALAMAVIWCGFSIVQLSFFAFVAVDSYRKWESGDDSDEE